MSATAAAAAPAAGVAEGLGVELNTLQDKEAWSNLHPARFTALCEAAYLNGDFTYAKTAPRVNHDGMKDRMYRRTGEGVRSVNNEEAYSILRVTQKVIALMMSRTSRSMHCERDAKQKAEGTS